MKFLTLFLLSLVMNLAAYASHLRCGQIIVQQKASGSRTVKITIQVWTSYAANVLFGGDQDVLNFGDGTTLVIPETQNQIVPQFPDLGFATFTTEHTYASLGRYVVSYREPNRNAEVINFDNSVNTTMYLESEFNLFGDRKYTSPLPLASPYYYNYTSTALSRSVAAVDSNDFALRYVLVPLLADRSTQVLNYRRPTTMSLNQYEGLLTWDNTFFGQSLMGEYVIGMRIEQFIWTEAGWVRVGYVYRDYQIILTDNNSFESTIIQTDQSITKIVVEENDAHTFRVFVPQQESSEYTIELNTELP